MFPSHPTIGSSSENCAPIFATKTCPPRRVGTVRTTFRKSEKKADYGTTTSIRAFAFRIIGFMIFHQAIVEHHSERKADRARQQAFTLMELLIVISLTAVLACILYSVGRKSLQSSTRVDSINTMRNIGISISQYVTENNQTLPGPMPGQQHPGLLKAGRWLPNYIHPYLSPDQEAIPAAEFEQTGAFLKGFAPKHWETWYKRARPATPRVYEIPYSQYQVSGQTIVPFGKVTPLTPPSNYLTVIQNLSAQKLVALRSYHGTSKSSALAPPLGEIQDYTVQLYFDWHVESSVTKD